MSSLLIQSCSATKNETEKPTPAIDLYDGYFFRIIKKALRAGHFNPGIDIIIISARHGVVETDEQIPNYDHEMDRERAAELNGKIVDDIATKVAANGYENVWVNLGTDYLPAINGLENAVDVPVKYIEGSGIGMKGKRLKNLVSEGQPNPASGV